MHGHTMEYNGNQKKRGLMSFPKEGKKNFDNSVMLKLGDNADIRKHTPH